MQAIQALIRSPQTWRRITFLVRTAFIIVVVFDLFFAGSIVFKLATAGLRGTWHWIAEIGGPERYWGFFGSATVQALATLALWRLQLKLASRTVTAHVVNKTLREVDRILARAAACDRAALLRDLTARLTVNLKDGEPRLMELTLWRSKVKSADTGMAWETAITTVRVFAKGPVPAELNQSLRELVSNLRG